MFPVTLGHRCPMATPGVASSRRRVLGGAVSCSARASPCLAWTLRGAAAQRDTRAPVPTTKMRWAFSVGSRHDFCLKFLHLAKRAQFSVLLIINVLEIEAVLFVPKEWRDVKLRWNPDNYGGIRVIRVPSDSLWTPDIVLFDK